MQKTIKNNLIEHNLLRVYVCEYEHEDYYSSQKRNKREIFKQKIDDKSLFVYFRLTRSLHRNLLLPNNHILVLLTNSSLKITRRLGYTCFRVFPTAQSQIT